MPKYWITTHWPELLTNPSDIRHVYVQERFREYVKSMQIGDRILIYEFRTGPARRIEENGKAKLIKRHKGREATVSDSRIAETPHVRKGYQIEDFDGKGLRNFSWGAITNDHQPVHVPKATVTALFGWGPKYTFQGFNGGRGIREISESQYLALLKQSEPRAGN